MVVFKVLPISIREGSHPGSLATGARLRGSPGRERMWLPVCVVCRGGGATGSPAGPFGFRFCTHTSA